jgi:signal transduction histidine kinase
MTKPLQVLLIEDSEDDAAIVEVELQRAGYTPVCQRVETREALSAALARRPWDLIIADYRLPQFDGLSALALVKERGLDLPFIIVSGYIAEDTAVAAMKAGAHDYVMKDKLGRLGSAVERELREAEVRRERRRAEEALRRAYEELEMRVQERTAELKTANTRLQNAIAERRRLEYELLEITEKERRRIGLDLHDDLGQQLSGLALMTKGLELKLAKRRARETSDAARIHNLVQQAMNHARDLARDLATLDLKGDDLPAALGGLAQHASGLFKISCQFEADAALPPLEATAASQLYKIAQEAVTNAIKHAKAKSIRINLANGGTEVVLTVHNDGLPFPNLKIASTGMGLRIMSYRASLIGGSLDIKATGAHGTRVVCSVPLGGKRLAPPAIRARASPGSHTVGQARDPGADGLIQSAA